MPPEGILPAATFLAAARLQSKSAQLVLSLSAWIGGQEPSNLLESEAITLEGERGAG